MITTCVGALLSSFPRPIPSFLPSEPNTGRGNEDVTELALQFSTEDGVLCEQRPSKGKAGPGRAVSNCPNLNFDHTGSLHSRELRKEGTTLLHISQHPESTVHFSHCLSSKFLEFVDCPCFSLELFLRDFFYQLICLFSFLVSP